MKIVNLLLGVLHEKQAVKDLICLPNTAFKLTLEVGKTMIDVTTSLSESS